MITNRDSISGRILPSPDPDERFWQKVRLEDEIFPENGCMLWTGVKVDGYGIFWSDGRNWPAHRWAYERYRGPVPTGLQLDHLCRNRACVNPDHVEPVTGQINILRGNTGKVPRVPKTHCKNGHEFTSENTYHYVRDGKPRRGCKACLRGNYRRYWHSLPEEKRRYWSLKTSDYRKGKK